MNAVFALCHFCEIHGPSVLFCTQAFHDSDHPEKVLQAPPPHKERGQPGTDDREEEEEDKKRYYGRPEYFMRSAARSASEEGTPDKETCVACQGLPSEYLCNDHEAKVSYISSKYAYHPEVFSIVRQACVRSLSCEVCPGREGPIFFGDEQRGHVFSHTFFLKDSQARGFHRWYSIIVIMMDKIFLLNSWPFLLKHIRTLIDELQEKASKVYNVEQSDCPQRALRLNNVIGMTPGNFHRQRGGNKPMRSLMGLTNDKDIFANLHLWFTWILKAGGNRLTETLLEGPPTEDTVIDLEKQEETEEGFMLVTTKKIPKEYVQAGESSGEEADEKLILDQQPKILSIRHLYKVLGKEKFHEIVYHLILGNQIIICCSQQGLVSSLIQSLKVFLPKGCFRPIIYSKDYQDSWKCNILGLSPDVTLPPHVENSPLHVKLEITPSAEHSTNLNDFTFNVCSSAQLPAKCPAVLTRMENAIQDETLPDNVLDCLFTSVKEEWMNKVKVLFKFSRATSRTPEETQNLLHVLGAQDYDKQLMKFWMTGLSIQYKTHVLSATMSQCHGNEGAAMSVT